MGERLLAVLVVAVCGLVGGCSNDPSTPAATRTSTAGQFNAATAQIGIQEYFTEILDALPPGVSLSALHFANPHDRTTDPQPLIVGPCNDDIYDKTGTRQAAAAFWLEGIPADRVGDYFDTVTQRWRDRQWNMTVAQPGAVVKAITDDGYQLTAARSDHHPEGGNVTESIMLVVASPCFPISATATVTPFPTRIEHN